RYLLSSQSGRCLSRLQQTDNLQYFSLPIGAGRVREIRFSEFNEAVHSFTLSEREVKGIDFDSGLSLIGPMVVVEKPDAAFLIAYEHGSQVPDAFVEYRLTPERAISLRAVKGNYEHGRPVNRATPYETIWMQIGAVSGSEEDLARAYRTFVLRFLSENEESRKPYIFYNTWAYQERNKWWNNAQFLDSMREDRILSEIEVAHQLGIDVFVLDTGWYEKTGDWRVNGKRFSESLSVVKKKLDQYGMRLGLWFDPTAAAVTSNILRNHEDCIRSWQGKPSGPHPIWETEDSYNMCLVSRYYEAFANELIRLTKEVGMTYFKWDAIHQYGCDAAGHGHGTEENSSQERADSYAFQLGIAMSRIVDKLCAACPEAIVDFDITEGHRYVGLGFLASGKYFLINNGPYYHNFDIPYDGTYWSNIFVHHGPARGWICRTPLTFDKWIPTVLFLTHYLPDDPEESQWINLASLVLGQNGIWGDLLAISPEGVERIRTTLARYKAIRGDITEASLLKTGEAGGSPEIYEKISPASRKGVVSLFSSAAGSFSYVTSARVVGDCWHSEGIKVTISTHGYARIDAEFMAPGAKIVFFGVE
ncbi:MAG TPA: alpha-galactosidase, partial [Capsulimonadaceae bacterium]|nr:alpha-galactosidase [Capsulimonadaceae bacterium]